MKKFISFLCALTIVLSASAVPAHQQRASKMQIQPTEKVMLGQTIAPRAEKKAFVKQEKATQPQVRHMKADSSKVVAQYSVAAAIQEVNEGRILDDDEIIIEGIVTKIEFKGKNFKKYGSANIYVKDVHGLEGEFEFYNCYSLLADTFRTSDPEYDASSASWASFESVTDGNGVTVKVGDQVTAQGKFKLYNGVYELNQGCYLTHIETPVQPEIPTEDVLGYQQGLVGVCIYVPKEIACNEIVFVGTYNGWDGTADNCVRFAPVMGYENWYYVAVVDASDDPEGKPVILDNEGNFNWEFQVGAATKISGGAEIIPGQYQGEIDIKHYGKDVVNYYTVDAWKKNPCELGYYNYTINVLAPDACPDMKPAIIGSFNGWEKGVPMVETVEDSITYYTLTIRDIPGGEFKIKEASDTDWSNELIMWYDGDSISEAGWYYFNNFQLPDTDEDMSIYYNFSDNAYFKFKQCEALIPGDTIRHNFAAPIEYSYWNNPGDWYFYANDDQFIISLDILSTNPESPVGTYTEEDLDLEYSRLYQAINDSLYAAASIVGAFIEIKEQDTLLILNAEIKGYDGHLVNTYLVSMFAELPKPVVPTREEDLVVEKATLSLFDGAWQITGYNTDGDRYVNIASYSDAVAGDYILSQLALARVAVFDEDRNYVWYDAAEAELSIVQNQRTGAFHVTGTMVAAYGDDAIKFNVNITTATGKQYDAEDEDFAAQFAEYEVYVDDDGVVYVDAINEALQYIELEILLPEGETELVPGVYPVSGEGIRPSVVEGDYNGGIIGSFAANLVYNEESEGYGIQVPLWWLTEGKATVAEDGSITVEAVNSYGRSIKASLLAPAQEEQYCGDNLTWEVENGVLTIEGTGAMYDFEELGPWGTEITEVKLPEGITYIGENAFFYCLGLTHVTIPSTVEQIGHYAFCSTGLETVEIPATVSILGYYSFAYNSALVSVSAAINENLAWYGDVFANCDNIQNLEAPLWYLQQIKSKNLVNVRFTAGGKFSEEYAANLRLSNKSLKALDMSATSLKALPDEALRNCYNLEAVALPANLQVIGTAALAECKLLQAIEIPASVTEIGNSAFEDCRSLVDVKFAKNSQLESIGNWAFYNCHDLPAINIPDGVVSIGDGAFYGCVFASTLSLPASIVAIGDNAFALCSKLAEIHVDALLPPDIMDKTFFEVSPEAPVFVPDGSYDAYKNHIYWGRMNIVKNTQGMDQVGSGDKARKIVRDGQLLIIRGDRTFTTTGAEIK